MAIDIPPVDGRLIENDSVVHALYDLIREGNQGLDMVPQYVKKVIKEECWRTRWVRPLQQLVTFDRFEDFVAARIPEGLGASLKTLKNLCRDDAEALDLMDRATANPPGRPTCETVNNINSSRPAGTSKDAALRRLRKDRPDLHAQVLSGELSAHAAMLKAGFRKTPSPLDVLKRTWAKTSKEDKDSFIAWASAQES